MILYFLYITEILKVTLHDKTSSTLVKIEAGVFPTDVTKDL